MLTWVVDLQLAVALAVLWQASALRGEVSTLAADTRARLSAVEQRLNAFPSQLPHPQQDGANR